MSTIYFATLSMSNSNVSFLFFCSQKPFHLPYQCFIDGYAHLDVGGFFTVENDTGRCWEELSSVISYGAIFIRCPLFSIIKCLSSAALVTYGAPIFFLWMFVPISTCLCNKYYTPFLEIFNFSAIYLREQTTLNQISICALLKCFDF